MSPLRALRGWRGPPLAWQILGLLVGGLAVAQLVTLFLTMVLPPEPKQQYQLDEIAAALRGADAPTASGRGLERRVQRGPPDLSGSGWLRSERSRDDLARLLDADARDVALAFYTPLPFAGALSNERRTGALSFADPGWRLLPASYVMMLDGPPAGGGAPGGGMPGGVPGGGASGFPPQALPGGSGFPQRADGTHGSDDRRNESGRRRLDGRLLRDERGDRSVDAGDGVRASSGAGPTEPGGVRQGGRGGQSNPAVGENAPGAPSAPQVGPPRPAGAGGPPRIGTGGAMRDLGDAIPVFPGLDPADSPPMVQHMPATEDASPPAGPAPSKERQPRATVSATPESLAPPGPPLLLDGRQAAQPVPTPAEAPVAVPLRAPARGLFGFAPAPFVEGDFVAAWRQPDGRWAIVQPVPEPFPTAWQRRLILWFAVALAIVGPFGLLFARRLVKPLSGFAAAAEQLGRDPSAAVLPLAGPAEIGRAANAFNLMQSRLRAFVDDRTAMVGAISHDLRTPLTRMRFRIEEVDDEDSRAGMIGEVEEMEAMIASVLDYIRDASTPGVRERLDLRLLVDDVVDDALMVGGDVKVERAEPAPVEVDVLGMRRVLDNLLGNAIKYGVRARVRLRTDADEAVAEIIDDGPGLPEEELERVFEPFYRSPEAVASDKRGSGLGLAVCRSIARAHGGDVRLVRSAEGFLAQVRVPLAYGAERQAA